MARTIKAEEHAAKRNEILNAVLQLIYTKGYERMTIQDILSLTGISSGAFYHYFDTKPAVLDALIERMQDEAKAALLPLLDAANLSAVQKLQRFFETIDNMRLQQQSNIIELLTVWYNDDNAIVRHKVESAVAEWRVPLLTSIVYQGIQENVFDVAHPETSGQVVFSLLQGMAHHHAQIMLARDKDEDSSIEAIVSSQAAYMDAVERVLGASPNVLSRTSTEAVAFWVRAVRGKT